MGKKVERICQSLKKGVSDGLGSHQLYQFVAAANPSASAKQIKRASLMAMAELNLSDKSSMEVIYSIAFDRGLRPSASPALPSGR
jgi:hypothetical protein